MATIRDVHAFLLQETNLRETHIRDLKKYAARKKILVIAAPIPDSEPDGARGGTAIMIPYEAIPKQKGESHGFARWGHTKYPTGAEYAVTDGLHP